MKKMIVFCLMAIVMSVNVNAQSLKNKLVDDVIIEGQIKEYREKAEHQIRYGTEDRYVTLRYDKKGNVVYFGDYVHLKDYYAFMKKLHPTTIKYYGLTFHKFGDDYVCYGCTRDMCVKFVERFVLDVKKGEEELMYFKYMIYHHMNSLIVKQNGWKEYKERVKYWAADDCLATFRLNNITISYSGNYREMTLSYTY